MAVAAELPPVAIVKQSIETFEDGSYRQSFESADGVKVAERGRNKQLGEDDAGMSSSGSFSYVAPDGTFIKTTWTADENGFKAEGDHLPTPPPMPEHVVKMLEDLRKAGKL